VYEHLLAARSRAFSSMTMNAVVVLEGTPAATASSSPIVACGSGATRRAPVTATSA
jgi:hypothetical protein